MDHYFYLDASALAKRYVRETGTPVLNQLFRQGSRDHMMCLHLGTMEVISIFVRKRNVQRLTVAAFNQALTDFKQEILDAADFKKVPVTDALINGAFPLIPMHSLNATDALVLRSALDLAVQFRSVGYDLVLVASDQRLLRAARAEGLLTFDPETQDQLALAALLGP
jgi:predicted nucleic acid-binding protein